ncbi:MAG TPA: serine hydrolase [Streptosporangiaceae bacterium]|jgi:beta-lactamase class A
MSRPTAARVEAAFADAGVHGHLHVRDLDTGREIGVRADDPVVLASVFKVPLLVTFQRMAARGDLSPTEQVTVPADVRSAGPTGVSAMLDDVRLSLRDLACLMITVSDNTAADVLYDRVGGAAAVNATMDHLGLGATRVLGNGRDLHDSLLADAGITAYTDLWPKLDEPGTLARLSALDPARTSHSTPRELTRLLALIWNDEAAPAEGCAAMRRLFGLQVWPHRLASGFPYDDVRVSGKTGTLPTLRCEVGVVEYPDGGRYAVAVFTRAFRPVAVLPAADAVIGTAAHLAVESLRH